MALLAGVNAINQNAASNKPHIMGFQTARSAANDTLLEVWNGSANTARKFVVDLDGKPYSAAWVAGDLPYVVAGSVTSVKRMDTLAIGTVGKILRSTGTAPAWTTATVPDTTTRGAVLVASAANVWAALAVGTAGKVLRSDGTDLLYSTATIPDTAAAGDLLYGSASNTWTALAKGTARQVLQMNAGATLPEWTSDLSLTSVTATTLTGTLATAAQANVTSLGTLTSLNVGAITSTGLIQTTLVTQQLSLRYDASNHLAVTVASNGAVTYNATGAGAAHSFSDLVTAAAGLTVSSGQTLTLTGATVAGTPTWSSAQAITVSTAAQTNITSVGTLTSLNVGAVTSTGLLKTTLTSQQLALHYDASNHLAVTVASNGAVTYNATGAGAGHAFSDLVTANAGLTVASGQTLTVTGATVTGLGAASVAAGTFPAGDFVVQGKLTANYFVGSVSSPSALPNGNTNNYDPSTARTLRMTGTAGAANNITGISGGASGRRLTLIHVGTTETIVLKHEDANSSEANRIIGLNASSDVTLSTADVAELEYDGTSSRWRVLTAQTA